MQLTQEQQKIINSTDDIKINAVAGSGKTTTIIEYAKARPANSKILYLAFNKSVKLEAKKKFVQNGMSNVTVETAHSLAYRHIVRHSNYKIKNQGYKTYEIAELLGLQVSGEKHAEYIVANHINRFITYFCNSEKKAIQELNYLDIVSDPKAKSFVKTFYRYIEKQTRTLLRQMDKGEIEITHDFYLKKFQLSKPKLNYDYILFDEGQDASPAMLNVFLRQEAKKVIVGDTHQQIYGWRHAVNSLNKVKFKNFNLTTSFRFCQDIANLSLKVLELKKYLDEEIDFTIKGIGSSDKIKTKAVLARTNLGLLLKAIKYVTEKRKVKKIYFEGNINSYTYAEDGASLYDVLNLYNGKRRLIKDKLIKQMRDMNELTEYIEKTEDTQLGMMVEIVKKYGNRIPGIINEIKERHIEGDQKEDAEMIFSTVHRCKGMEYDAIQIVGDFIDEENLKKYSSDKNLKINHAKLNEEINLLYVAITRTKNCIHIPETLMPENFPRSSRIHLEKKSKISPPEKESQVLERAYSVNEVREKYEGAYKPWTQELDDELTIMYCEEMSVRDIAQHFGRTTGAIRSRIKKLELS